MVNIKTTAAAALVSLATAFPASAGDVSVQRIGEVPSEIDGGLFSATPEGTYRIIFEGANTNGEDLNCIYIQGAAYQQAAGGLSCNWADPAEENAPN